MLISKKYKMTIQLLLAIFLVFIGVVLLFMGFFATPVGEIHHSVLVGYGEVSTFAGSLLGIDYAYRLKKVLDNDAKS